MTYPQESRSHRRLKEYWDSLRGSRLFPTENEIDPDEIADIWPSCFLISIDDVTRRLGYRYSYLGERLVEAYGTDINDSDMILTMLSSGKNPTTKRFDDVIRYKVPLMDESEFVNMKKLVIKYRTCLVPFGGEDREVSHILGCMRWRSF